jgi:hypothetical protein
MNAHLLFSLPSRQWLYLIHFLTYPASKVATNNACHLTSLTSSELYLPMQQLYNYLQVEAISETPLHLSIHSSKINKLLSILLTIKRQPMLIQQSTSYQPWLFYPYCLHSFKACELLWFSITRNSTNKLPCCKAPYISCTPSSRFNLYICHQQQ